MTQTMDLPSESPAKTVEEAHHAAQQRAASLKALAEAAAKEVLIWKDLRSYRSKGWWFHLRALFEREAKFFARLRESEAPLIKELEDLFREAKNHTDELLYELPRNIEQMAERHGLALDYTRSVHPKYQFREGFITLEIDTTKRLARLKDYEEKLGEMPPDIEAIAHAIRQHDERLFGRKFNGPQFLEKLRRNYLALIKKEGKADGDPLPLRKVARRIVDNERNYRRDEFLIDLSRLAVNGPPSIGGYGFEFQQTKDTDQGFLLHGRAGRGMVNLLIFRKVTP